MTRPARTRARRPACAAAFNDFQLRDLSGVAPGLGEMKRLSPRQKAWGLVSGAPEALFVLNPRKSLAERKEMSSMKRVIKLAGYVSRGWRLPLCDAEGLWHRSAESVKGELRGWGMERSRRPGDARILSQCLLGLNGEVDRAAFEQACLSWCREHLKGRPWLIGFHYDRARHAHAHVLFRHRHWETGRCVRIGPAEDGALREDLAARLVEAGLSANATRRFTRGESGRRRLLYAQWLMQARKGGSLVLPDAAREIEEKARRLAGGGEPEEPEMTTARRSRAQVFSYARAFIEEELLASGDPRDLELARRLEAYYSALEPVRSLAERRAQEILLERSRKAARRAGPASPEALPDSPER